MNNKPRRYSTRRRVLVTGGAGFLGSHLCDRLIQQGCDVLCVDNFFTGTKDNIAHLIDNPNFELMRHDVTQDERARRDQHAGPGKAGEGQDPASIDQLGGGYSSR